MRVGTKEWQSVSAIWSQLGFWASSLVFVLASMLVPEHHPPGAPAATSCCSPPCWSAPCRRAPCASSACCRSCACCCASGRSAPRFKLVILWGGVRGAVTLALALAVAENDGVPPEVRHLVSVLATGFVLFTLLVQATTLRR